MGPGEGGVREAAAAFEAMLTPPEEDKKQPAEAQPEGEEPEAAETDITPDSDELEGQEVEATADEEQNEEPAEAAKVFTVKIDGKEVEVTEDELKLGYSRTADYTRKTQQLAEQRKQFEGELEAARMERAEYAQLLPKLRAGLEAGMGPEPNWAELRQQDPAKAAVLWQQREDMRRHLEGVKAEEARLQQQFAREQAEAAEQRSVEQRNRLLEKFPRWRDDKFRTSATAEIRQTLQDVGFAPEEAVLTDHRSLILAWKAAQYDKLQVAKGKVKDKVAAAPVVKPGGVVPKAKSSVERAREVQRSTGSVRDTAKLFESLI
jgi:hypothetical protein